MSAAGFVLASWRGVTTHQIVATFLLGVAFWLYHIPTGLIGPASVLGYAIIFCADQIKAWSVLLAYLVVERLAGEGRAGRGAYAIAAVVGSAVGIPFAVGFVVSVRAHAGRPVEPGWPFLFYAGAETAMLAAAVLWIAYDRRRAQRARALMHRAELERIAAEKRSIESDLQAMQARVEPQFLFNTLTQVRDLYDRNAGHGEHMLDELIAYLRAAMPRMRDTSSTIGQEVELARAYLAIVKVRLGERFRYEIDAPPQLYALRMPPMILLPLIDHAIGADARSAAAVPSAVRIAIELRTQRILLRVAETGRAAPRGERHGLDALRGRLGALYGAGASVAYAADTAESAVDLPVETFDPGPLPQAAEAPRALAAPFLQQAAGPQPASL